jgi:cyclic beta-1,2-glucan synthetase
MVRDVGFEGQAGWSWYTGSSGWLWRTAVEELLGLKFHGDKLEVQPRLPEGWPGYSAVVRRPGETELHIEVSREGILINGRPPKKTSPTSSQVSKNMV